MLVKDEIQQAAELRQAFLKHFPRRMDMLQRKGLRLVRGPWDVNSATLVLQEVQRLAGAAGKHGVVDASERLYQIELRLGVLLNHLSVPDDEQRRLLETLFAQLPVDDGSEQVPGLLSAAALAIEAPPVKRPIALQPPGDYWRRFSSREVAAMDSDNAPTAPAARPSSSAEPPPAEVLQSADGGSILLMGEFVPAELDSGQPDHAQDTAAGPSAADGNTEPAASADAASEQAGADEAAAGSAARRVFYLADIAPFARELCAELTRSGYLLERVEGAEELKELLGSLTPDLVIIDAAFFDEIEHLGEFLRRVRARLQSAVPLLLFAPSTDLESRLKALRAGAALVLPAEIAAADAAGRIRELVAPAAAEPFRVMIVEDDRSQALFAESVLKKAGMETCVVSDGLQTLDQLERFRPDLILMDLYMPEISGMELTAIIRERPDFISTPIVFLSGEQDSEKQFEALDAGGDDFLSKPIRPKHLMAAVNNRARRARAIDRRRQQQERAEDTGLHERAMLLDQLSESMVVEGSGGGLLYIEIVDGGHWRERVGLVGYERIAAQVGAIIGSLAGHGEMAARYGNDSFLLLSPTRSAAQLAELAEQLAAAVAAESYGARSTVAAPKLAIGAALLDSEFVDPGALLNAAERCASRAREHGGGFELHASAQAGADATGVDPAEVLREALQDDRLELLFQPIVSLQGGEGAQYQALVRMPRRDATPLDGSELLDLAVESGHASALDRWSLRLGLATVDERARRGERMKLYLLLSADALADATLPSWLGQMLATRKLDAERLRLEFRLGDVLARLQEAMAALQALRRLGVGLVLDQFEPDMTALQMLSYLPVDHLKLHTRYAAPQLDEATAVELRQLIEAAHGVGKKVMATRVENAPTAASLWTLGVDYIQGNFIQQPGAELGFDFSASAL